MDQWTWQESFAIAQVRKIIVRLRERRKAAWAEPAAPRVLLDGLDTLTTGKVAADEQRVASWRDLPFEGPVVLATLWSARNVADYAEYEVGRQVAAARELPPSQRPDWRAIGLRTLGITGQAAQARFAHRNAPAPVPGWRESEPAALFDALMDYETAAVTREWLTTTVSGPLPVSPDLVEGERDKLKARLNELAIETDQYWAEMAPARRTALARIAAARDISRLADREVDYLVFEAVAREVSFADIGYALAKSRQAARLHSDRRGRGGWRLLEGHLEYEVGSAYRVASKIASSPESSPELQERALDFLELFGESVREDLRRQSL